MSTPLPTSLEPDRELLIGALLRVAYQELGASVNAGLAVAGYPDVRAAHFPILQSLHRHPDGLRISVLAERAEMSVQAMWELVEALVGGAYVERIRDPHDGRARLIRFTPRGGWRWGESSAGSFEALSGTGDSGLGRIRWPS